MTQEDKELLLKDLCARLPYKVKIQCINSDNETVIEELFTIGIEEDSFDCNLIEYVSVKPYLFPLSNMTKEQYKEWCDLGEEPLDEILHKNVNGIKMTTLEHHLLIAKGMIDSIQWCYKNHFDVYGLIPKGLAINATNLNIY